MHIRHLADCQEAIPQIARWLFEEWGRFVPGASIERGILRLQERIHRDRVPLSLVALDGKSAVGTVSLIACDMEIRPDLSPWLASLYVVPEQRRRGIGSALVESAVCEARRLGIDTLYLFTDTSEALYAALGWQRMLSCIYQEREVVIMRKPMDQPQRGAPGQALLPAPPKTLSSGEVTLRFSRVVPGESSRGLAPYFHFRILTADGSDVGHINFRVGDTEHVRLCAGHIGYEIAKSFRGHRYAWQACCAIAPFVRSVYEAVTITCDPDNHPSRRTIERLGARFIDEIPVPAHDPLYQRGSRIKRRYRWIP